MRGALRPPRGIHPISDRLFVVRSEIGDEREATRPDAPLDRPCVGRDRSLWRQRRGDLSFARRRRERDGYSRRKKPGRRVVRARQRRGCRGGRKRHRAMGRALVRRISRAHHADSQARDASDAQDVAVGDASDASPCSGVNCSGHGVCMVVAKVATCVCATGYATSGLNCNDVDECVTNNGGCDKLTTCTNTEGGRTCGPCPTGYSGTGVAGCVDVNECLVSNGGCDTLTTCSNTVGGRSPAALVPLVTRGRASRDAPTSTSA